jgi:GNAT superfamily N-acetyltransferase
MKLPIIKNNISVKLEEDFINFYIGKEKIGYIEYFYYGDAISNHMPVNEKEWYLAMIEVYDKFKGNNYSEFMLNYAKKYAESLGATIITLRVDYGMGFGSERNPDLGLEKLYLANGFEYTYTEEECANTDTKNLGAMHYRITT